MPDYEQGRYWMLTIPEDKWHPPTILPPNMSHVQGQLEEGKDGYRHWQLVVCFNERKRLRSVKQAFCPEAHCEVTRSDAAIDYVWKAETRVAGTQFLLGTRTEVRMNSKTDWDEVRDNVACANFAAVPSKILLTHYNNLKKFATDNMAPVFVERSCVIYWGGTGVGKSRRAWCEAGWDAYPKIPCTKFWDGYRGQEHVVIDEFTGQVNIEHFLRWLDRYPVTVEQKGAGCVLAAKKYWITSNIDPVLWWPMAHEHQREAFMRRVEIVHMDEPWEPPVEPRTPRSDADVINQEATLREFLNKSPSPDPFNQFELFDFDDER